MSQLKR